MAQRTPLEVTTTPAFTAAALQARVLSPDLLLFTERRCVLPVRPAITVKSSRISKLSEITLERATLIVKGIDAFLHLPHSDRLYPTSSAPPTPTAVMRAAEANQPHGTTTGKGGTDSQLDRSM